MHTVQVDKHVFIQILEDCEVNSLLMIYGERV